MKVISRHPLVGALPRSESPTFRLGFPNKYYDTFRSGLSSMARSFHSMFSSSSKLLDLLQDLTAMLIPS